MESRMTDVLRQSLLYKSRVRGFRASGWLRHTSHMTLASPGCQCIPDIVASVGSSGDS
jgi:hypothetical protein